MKITKEELYQLYIIDNKSMKQIAQLIPCSTAIVHKLLHKYNIPTKPKHKTYNGVWNKGLTIDDPRIAAKVKKQAKTLKSKYDSGELVIWNKGLDNSDPRVALNSKKAGESRKEYYKTHESKCKGVSLSEEHKKKLSLAKGGTGIPYENAIYGAAFTTEVKERIRERDQRRCQICNKYESEFKERLHVHHIDDNPKNTVDSNLISLCRGCHNKTKVCNKKEYWHNYLQNITDFYCI